MSINLPTRVNEDSAAGTKLYFDTYGQLPLEFAAVDVDFTITFFKKKGFDDDAALVVATTLLRQAKIENTPIAQVIGSLNDFNGLELSTLVGEILNNSRPSTSTLGFRTVPVFTDKIRNISA
jgi:hypothetical protein